MCARLHLEIYVFHKWSYAVLDDSLPTYMYTCGPIMPLSGSHFRASLLLLVFLRDFDNHIALISPAAFL